MIVEDGELLRELLVRAMRQKFPDAETVSAYEDEQSALKAIADEDPDLVLTDLQLSKNGTEGISVLCAAKKRSADTSVILMSGSEVRPEWIDQLKNEPGLDGFLEKPFGIKVLTDMIDNLTSRTSSESVAT